MIVQEGGEPLKVCVHHLHQNGKGKLETVCLSQGLEGGEGFTVPKEKAHKVISINCLPPVTSTK